MRVWVLGIAVVLGLSFHSALECRADSVAVTRLGDPIWKPVDFHLFSVRFEADFSLFVPVMSSLLPPPNHEFHPDLGIGPGIPHSGPYDGEWAAGVAAEGYIDKTVFTTQEVGPPYGILFAFMLVPDPGTAGRSPDFDNGPILPNALFPLFVDADLVFNGASAFGPFSFTVPPLDGSLNPPFDVDGHSHTPLFFSMNSDPLNPIGSWEFQIKLTDQAGNGYMIAALFDVVPEPSSVLMYSLGCLGAVGWRWRHQIRGNCLFHRSRR